MRLDHDALQSICAIYKGILFTIVDIVEYITMGLFEIKQKLQ
jgi:hypothetical protein